MTDGQAKGSGVENGNGEGRTYDRALATWKLVSPRKYYLGFPESLECFSIHSVNRMHHFEGRASATKSLKSITQKMLSAILKKWDKNYP